MNRQSKLAKGQYPENDWQTFKQLLNIWFDFAEYREYRDDLPFQCSRSKLALNIAGLIKEKGEEGEDRRFSCIQQEIAMGCKMFAWG